MVNSRLHERFVRALSGAGHQDRTYLISLFFNPGQLTQEYIKGRRVHYVQPIRLYLFSSILFFFLLSLLGNNFDAPQFYGIPDGSDLRSNEDLTGDSILYYLPGISNPSPIWTPANSSVLLSTSDQLNLESRRVELEISADGKASTSIDSILTYANDLTLTPEEVVEKIRISESDLNRLEHQILIQLVRIWRTSFYDIYQLIVRNIPFMMFVLVPLFALLLKLAYFRHSDWTVLHHVVHSLHLHSFFYLLGVVVLLVFLIPSIPYIIQVVIIVSSLIYLVLYWWKSLRTLYGRSFFKTTLTYIILIGTYFLVGVLAFLSEIVISLYLL